MRGGLAVGERPAVFANLALDGGGDVCERQISGPPLVLQKWLRCKSSLLTIGSVSFCNVLGDMFGEIWYNNIVFN